MRAYLVRAAAAVLALASAVAHAGGPLGVCNNQPLKYTGAGTVTLNYDGGGTLGARTKAQADAIVTSAVSLWTNVSTATVTLARGSDLPVDVTSANYATYLGQFNDGKNPVVYDTDGTITDLLLGANAHTAVLGFAGSASYSAPTCLYAEGQAVINGAIAVSDASLTIVLAHEIGHLIGLDHTQIDSSQGLATSNYPLMYPVAYRTTATLHEDDVAAVSALYPDTTVNAAYGHVSGTLTLADGVTPVLGANIWAQENTTGQTFSIVSDYLTQGTGYFSLLLPPGTYTLHVEAIDSAFDGGSSVGPYADTYPSSASFQPPLYSSGTPMAPVTMGNATPIQVPVVAGCSANVAFRLNGAGTVTGNCAAPPVDPAAITSPADGSRLPGANVTFQWNTGTNAALYQLWIGNSAGAHDIGVYPNAGTTSTSFAVTGLPTDGRTLYVRLYTSIGGTWYSRDYTYLAATPPAASPATMSSPLQGTRLSGSTVTFQWNAGVGATLYQVFIGNSVGAFDIGYFPASGTTSTSTTVTGLPTDGRTVYVRLYSAIAGVWYFHDYTYIAAAPAAPPTPASISSPANGSTLPGSGVTFQWNAATNATLYQVFVGNSVGAYDIGYYPATGTTGTSTSVTGLPTDGRKLYVRLYSNIGGTYYFTDAVYTASGAPATPTPASISSPAPGSTLAGSSATFQWNAATGASLYQVFVGNSVGAFDIGYFPASGTTGTSTTVTGLPTDGRTLYVRLYTAISGTWYFRDYVYTAAGSAPPPSTPTPAAFTSPVGGATLSGSSVTFQWNAAAGATLYQVWVGNSVGAYDIGYYPASGTTATSTTVTGLPTDGRTLYVRLYTAINGAWYSRDFTYRSGP